MEGKRIQHQKSCKIPGHTLTLRVLIVDHIHRRVAQGKAAQTKLYRFRNPPKKTKLDMVKAMILHSPTPRASKSSMLMLLRVLPFITKEKYPYIENTEGKSLRFKIDLYMFQRSSTKSMATIMKQRRHKLQTY